jgi:hypothetical protein
MIRIGVLRLLDALHFAIIATHGSNPHHEVFSMLQRWLSEQGLAGKVVTVRNNWGDPVTHERESMHWAKPHEPPDVLVIGDET